MSTEPQYPLSQAESARLAALNAYELLGSPPETDFDAVVRLLAHATGMPMAWLGLLGSDQIWIKAQHGCALNPMPPDDVLCPDWVAHPRECLIVPDLADNARWAQHSLLAQLPGIRFLATMPVVDAAGHVLGAVCLADTQPRFVDAACRAHLADAAFVLLSVMEARRRAIELGRLAMTDHLTGVGNQAQFDLALQVEMGQAMRTGAPFTVLCMDLDGFKAINDGFGHTAGDEVLCEVAKRLQQQVRLGDTLARMRDDEFAVVMRHGGEEEAGVLAKRILKAVGVPIDLTTGDTVGVGISIGMAAYNDHVLSGADLVARANESLLQSKRRNERRWNMFLGGGRRLF